jgi:hypothetical protein
MSKDVRELVQAIKSQPTVAPQPSPVPSEGSPGFDWNPVVQGLITGAASALGMSVSPSTASSKTPIVSSSVDLPNIEARIKALEANQGKIESTLSSLTSSIETLARGQANLNNTLTRFVEAMTSSSSSNDSGSTGAAPTSTSNGSSPTTPSTKNSPSASPEASVQTKLPEITKLEPSIKSIDFKGGFVTADLESVITPNGENKVFMAAWYNGTNSRVLDITKFDHDANRMLETF